MIFRFLCIIRAIFDNLKGFYMEEQQTNETNETKSAEESKQQQPAEESEKEDKKQEPVKEKPKEKGPSIFDKIKNRLLEYRRVISVTSKPDKEEFTSSIKITAFGIALIGLIGFVIYLVYTIII